MLHALAPVPTVTAMRRRFRPCAVTMPRRSIAADARSLPLFAWALNNRGPLRPNGTMYDTGRIKPRRPCPRDFRETYVRIGWDGIMEHYHANWRCIRRWIDETGREDLRKDRAEYVKQHGKKALHVEPGEKCTADRQARRKRNVMGQTLSGGKK